MFRRVLQVCCVLFLVMSGFGAVAGEENNTASDSAAMCVSDDLAKPSEPGKPYTSVIIDATGFNLQRSMSPKIKRADGTEVWGTVKVDFNFLQEHGLVAYAASLEDARKCDRCGTNPMVVKAVDLAKGPVASDPVIAGEDAALLVEENAKGKFLDDFNVIFVKCSTLNTVVTAKN